MCEGLARETGGGGGGGGGGSLYIVCMYCTYRVVLLKGKVTIINNNVFTNIVIGYEKGGHFAQNMIFWELCQVVPFSHFLP